MQTIAGNQIGFGKTTPAYISGVVILYSIQGVAMLSSVSNNETAVQVNIHISRVFMRMPEMLLTHKDVLLKLEQLERKTIDHDYEIKLIFDYLKQLLNPKTEPLRKIDFKHKKED
jgi:hypothetical protein